MQNKYALEERTKQFSVDVIIFISKNENHHK